VAVVVLLRESQTPRPGQPGTAARPPAELAWSVPDGEETAIVEVMNGTDHRGLARTAARLLRSHGMDVVGYDNPDSTARTTLLVRRGDDRHARTVARALGVGVIRSAPDSTRHVDVTVVLGEDFRPETGLHP
jgi:hypothetical protein